MKLIIILMSIFLSIHARELSNVERGYATGAGIGAGAKIKMNHYQLSDEEKIIKCNDLLKKNKFAQRSNEHNLIANTKCLNILKSK
jgi:hypothetical protein